VIPTLTLLFGSTELARCIRSWETGVIRRGGHEWRSQGVAPLLKSRDPDLAGVEKWMICDDLWGFMVIYDGLWWFMMIYDFLWWFMVIYNKLWWFMMIYDGLWRFVYSLWWFLMIMMIQIHDALCNLWWFMMVYDGLWCLRFYDALWCFLRTYYSLWWCMVAYCDSWWMLYDALWFQMVYCAFMMGYDGPNMSEPGSAESCFAQMMHPHVSWPNLSLGVLRFARSASFWPGKWRGISNPSKHSMTSCHDQHSSVLAT